MICKCSKCGAVFEAKGYCALDVLIGAEECPDCKGKVNIILAFQN